MASTAAPKTSDEMPPHELSPQSSSTSNARLTPDSDSDDSDLEIGELGESFKLQRRVKDEEKRGELEEDSEDDDVGYRDSGRRRASVSTVQSYQLYTPDEERAVVRKFDRKLVLFVALLYMLSFLDRSSEFVVSLHRISADRYRYWKCQNCWPGSGPQSRFCKIRMGHYGFLHRIYLLRMDERVMEIDTRPYICYRNCAILGYHRFFTIGSYIICGFAGATNTAGNWRGRIYWDSILSVILLQA
jgi:hypothetical protein